MSPFTFCKLSGLMFPFPGCAPDKLQLPLSYHTHKPSSCASYKTRIICFLCNPRYSKRALKINGGSVCQIFPHSHESYKGRKRGLFSLKTETTVSFANLS